LEKKVKKKKTRQSKKTKKLKKGRTTKKVRSRKKKTEKAQKPKARKRIRKKYPNVSYNSVNPGDKFGKLTLIKDLGRKKNTNGYEYSYWLAKCDCGIYKDYILSNILGGYSTTCGKCKHPMFQEPIYKYWRSLKLRKKLGDEWKDFDKFIKDIGKRRSKQYLIALDKSKPLGVDNFRWGTLRGTYKTGGRMITFRERTQNMSAWARELNISRQRVHQLVSSGDIENYLKNKLPAIVEGP